MKLILAENYQAGFKFCRDHMCQFPNVVVRGVESLEGLRFRYEDVVRVPGWSRRSDIEEVEALILRTHIRNSYEKPVQL